jgi:hypothetical protein
VYVYIYNKEKEKKKKKKGELHVDGKCIPKARYAQCIIILQ